VLEHHHVVVETDAMDLPRAEPLSPRARRGFRLIVVAMIVIVAASLVYLQPSMSLKPTRTSPTINPPPVSRPGDLVSFDFVTPLMGWALVVTTALEPGPGQFSVFRTVDGAKRWQKQFTGGQGSLLGLGPQSIQFFDKANGFIVVAVGSINLAYRTTDGGAHWHPVGLPGSGVIAFGDPSHGWLLVSVGSPADQTVNLYDTGDGGSTWQRLPDPPPDLAGATTFRRPSEGWSGSRSDPLPHVYSSSDGGRSWDRHDLPLPAAGLPAGTIAHVHLLPGKGVVAFLDAVNGDQYTLTSFDGGTSWRYVQPRPSGNSFGSVIDFQDAFHWWAIDGWILYKSSDAGQSWKQASDQLDGAYVYIPHVLDSKHAWAQVLGAKGTGLALTTDGGLHWTRAGVPQLA
jgi:photosystem II stability/assembly factor-like uncharacterized protein